MSQRIYNACHRAVNSQHGSPSNSFLDQVIDAINPLPDEVFAPTNRRDIYSVMEGALGPWTGLLHRKAVMCEVLRVEASFESDYNWNEGVDVTNPHSLKHIERQETGAFQVSADSLHFDRSLIDCVDRMLKSHEPQVFIRGMKHNHALAVEYCARLLRFNTTWCGTINDPNQVISHVRRDAVAEFQTFLSTNSAPVVTELSLASLPTSEIAPPGYPTAANTIDTESGFSVAAPSLTALSTLGVLGAGNSINGNTGDKVRVPTLIQLAGSVPTLHSAQSRAAAALLAYDGEVYPQDACAITLSVLLRDAGINVPLVYQAIALGRNLQNIRKWEVVPVGQQLPGDVGSTCGTNADHGSDHIYLVLKKLNDDDMVIADNQSTQPHFRSASGHGKTPTKFFLRST